LRTSQALALRDDLPCNGALLTEEALIQIKAALARYRALIPENVLVQSPDGHGKSVIEDLITGIGVIGGRAIFNQENPLRL
jgi:hypothetical protein